MCAPPIEHKDAAAANSIGTYIRYDEVRPPLRPERFSCASDVAAVLGRLGAGRAAGGEQGPATSRCCHCEVPREVSYGLQI